MKIRRLSRRTVRWLGVGVAGLVVLVVVTAWLFLYTGIGTRVALAYLRGRLGPTTTIGAMTGRLASPLELISLRYSGDGLTVTADTVNIEWRLGKILRRQLDVRRLRVSGVEIETRETAPDTLGQPHGLIPFALLGDVHNDKAMEPPAQLGEARFRVLVELTVPRGAGKTGMGELPFDGRRKLHPGNQVLYTMYPALGAHEIAHLRFDVAAMPARSDESLYLAFVGPLPQGHLTYPKHFARPADSK